MRDWSIKGPVSLRDFHTGKVYIYDTIEKFVVACRRLKGSIGDGDVLAKTGNTEGMAGWIFSFRYLLYDECGLIIPQWKVEELLRQHPAEGVCWNEYRYRYSWQNWHYRRDPVPGTRAYRGGSSYFRNPGTHQEMKMAVALEHDEDAREYHIKPRRSRPNIPNAYWDIPSEHWDHNSWKRYRKTQWKPKS